MISGVSVQISVMKMRFDALLVNRNEHTGHSAGKDHFPASAESSLKR
jgi:hypothetical protein